MRRETYTAAELAQLTGMSLQHVRDEANRGRLPVVSIDPLLFSRRAIDRWLSAPDWQPAISLRHTPPTDPERRERPIAPIGPRPLELADVFAQQDAERAAARAQRKAERR